MVSNEIKMRVAQNCHCYQGRSTFSMMSFVESSQSCNNCKNYVRGHCTKDLFDSIYDNIRIN